jgi:hypothetical protein
MLKVAPLERATIEDILEDLWMKDTTVATFNKMKLIAFADSNAIDNQPFSLHSNINENESVEESLPKRQRLSSC